MRLLEKVALITGAASGLGKETAILFAKEGAKVILTDINQENGLKAVELINSNGGEATFIKHDVSIEDDGRAEYVKSLLPIGHFGEPIDVANGILYLASDDSKFTTGSQLLIDGGYCAQ